MWHAVIEFGGLWFWGIVGLVLLVEFLLVHNEKTGWVFGVAAMFAAVVGLFTTFDAKSFAMGWKVALLRVGAYVLIGVIWALVRWFLHAARRRSFFYDKKREWAESNRALTGAKTDLKEWSPEVRSIFLAWFANQWNDADPKMVRHYNMIIGAGSWKRGEGYRISPEDMAKAVFYAIVPQVRREKSRITLWLSFWPFSVLSYFLNDILTDFYRWLVRLVSGIMRGINNLVFAGMKKDLEV